MRYRRRYCAHAEMAGPYPYVEGVHTNGSPAHALHALCARIFVHVPLAAHLAHPKVKWFAGPLEILSPEAQRFLAARAHVDARMRCHYEDLYVGIELSAHPQLSLVNLERLLGRKDIYIPRSSQYIGADGMLAHWVRSEEAFVRVRRDFEVKRRLRAAGSSDVHCAPWRASFVELAHFPCCQNWTVCEPVTPLLRQRGGEG